MKKKEQFMIDMEKAGLEGHGQRGGGFSGGFDDLSSVLKRCLKCIWWWFKR